MKLTYLPLEAYKSRYTELLSAPDGWAERAFRARFEKLVVLRPEDEPNATIQNGKVLDKRQRPIWAMQQMAMLVNMPYPDAEKVYFDDFFHPGVEALPYSGKRFQAYAFCWAQTFDVYDFTYPEYAWMRPYEIMAFNIFKKVFVACDELKEMISINSPEWGLKTHAVGLPFSSEQVAQMRDPAFECEKFDVVYSSRFDAEKNPNFFLDLVAQSGVKAAICTGHKELKGDDHAAVQRALEMKEHGKLDIFTDMGKPQYYAVLANSHVQFNCSLQDWVSFTLLEALAYGCVPLYPNFRAMPSTLHYEEDNLYRPFDLGHAEYKLKALLNRAKKFPLANEILTYHDGTLARIADLMYKD